MANQQLSDHKQFNRLPLVARAILTTYENDNDKQKLFAAINENVETQKTVKSKQVRISMFRGLLRKHFGFKNSGMREIEVDDNAKQEYFDSIKIGLSKHHEDVVTEEMIKEIMSISPITSLMIRSGLRIGELLGNEMKTVKGVVQFKLNKKKKAKFYSVHILGDTKQWVKEFRAMKRSISDKNLYPISNTINIKLKEIIPPTFYKRSTHICRAIYVQYINKFKKSNLTLPQLITKYLNHDNPSASIYYNHIKIADDATDFINQTK